MRSRGTFLGRFDNGKPCAIIPEIEPHRVRVTVLYALKRTALSPSRLTNVDTDPAKLLSEWRTLCRAFVIAELGPDGRVELVEFDGTRRAAGELSDPFYAFAPSVDEIDRALGTSLRAVAAERSAELEGVRSCLS